MKECRTDRVLGWLVGEGAGCLGGRAEPIGNCCVGHTWRCWECVHWVGATGNAAGGSVQCPRHRGPPGGDPTGPASG